MKIDKTVLHETKLLSLGVAILSLLEQGVFFVCGAWWTGVLFSTLLVAAAQILNFFLLGVTVQRAVTMENQKRRELLLRFSLAGRMLLILCSVVLGILLPGAFDLWALLPPVFFNRITFLVRGMVPVKETPFPRMTENAEKDEASARDEIQQAESLPEGETAGADLSGEENHEKNED